MAVQPYFPILTDSTGNPSPCFNCSARADIFVEENGLSCCFNCFKNARPAPLICGDNDQTPATVYNVYRIIEGEGRRCWECASFVFQDKLTKGRPVVSKVCGRKLYQFSQYDPDTREHRSINLTLKVGHMFHEHCFLENVRHNTENPRCQGIIRNENSRLGFSFPEPIQPEPWYAGFSEIFDISSDELITLNLIGSYAFIISSIVFESPILFLVGLGFAVAGISSTFYSEGNYGLSTATVCACMSFSAHILGYGFTGTVLLWLAMGGFFWDLPVVYDSAVSFFDELIGMFV